jgi:hypothetical protein
MDFLQSLTKRPVYKHLETDVLKIDKLRLRHRPNWIYQMMLKIFQNVTSNDNFLVIESDCVILKKLEFFNENKTIFYLGRDHYHQPYYTFNQRLLGIGREYDHSFISEFMMYDKKVIKELLNKKNCNSVEDFLEFLYHYVDSDCYPSDYDLYGNYEQFENIKNNCNDNPIFNCPKFANNYKTCFIDNKNQKCCNTCKQYTECKDEYINCDMIKQKNIIKCDNNLWSKCCETCNSLNNDNYDCIDKLYDCDIRVNDLTTCNYYMLDNCCATCKKQNKIPSPISTTIPSGQIYNLTMSPTMTPEPISTTIPSEQIYNPTMTPTTIPTMTPTMTPTNTDNLCQDKISNCLNYVNTCNDNSYFTNLVKDVCCNTCNQNRIK